MYKTDIICSIRPLPYTGPCDEKVAYDPQNPNAAICNHKDQLYGWMVDQLLLGTAAVVHTELAPCSLYFR